MLVLGVHQGANAFLPFIPFLKLTEQKKSRNLVLALDVKQQEDYFGAIGYSLAVALRDKVAPIIASAHALAFVKSYFKPKEWHIYKNNNLVLLIPKDYLIAHDIKDVEQAGFNLDDWKNLELSQESMQGAQLYALLAPQLTLDLPFADLSRDSVKMISQTIKKDKNNVWKMYAVGHGAPDAHQVTGLNLADFRMLLDEFQERSMDFLVYETCYGGSTNQLRDVYAETQGSSFKKFSFPIIASALGDTPSFSAHPSSGITFKGLFSKVTNSMILEKKMAELLKIINEFNKGLDFASNYHWSNNLLLVRMPGKEFFEPIADNKFVFNLTEFNKLQRDGKNDSANFKCFLLNHPVLNEAYDFSTYSNFMIASGISRDEHYIKEITFAAQEGKSNETYFADVVELFNSLACPEHEKIFYLPTIRMGTALVLTDVTITQDPEWGYQALSIKGMVGDSFYSGYGYFDGKTKYYTTIALGSANQGKKYRADYEKAVSKHVKKQHQYPLSISSALVSFDRP